MRRSVDIEPLLDDLEPKLSDEDKQKEEKLIADRLPLEFDKARQK